MPKMKTLKGALKRFKKNGSGKLKRRAANRNHILTKKSISRKRRLRIAVDSVSKSDEKSVKRMLNII